MEDSINNQLYAPQSHPSPLLHTTNQTLLHPPPPLYLQPSFQPSSKSLINRPFLEDDNIFGVDDEDFGISSTSSSSCNKKRRLRSEQVQFLEKSFEVENKLEPERKFQLAKEIGLHPRQVAIWFQNRRARFKTKRIEKDFAALKQTFDSLQQQYDLLLRDNHTLQQQVDSLKKRLIIPREEEDGGVNSSKHIEEEMGVNATTTTNSSKSDVLDSDSPISSHDFSSHHQQEDNINNNNNNNNNNLLKTLSFLPKLEDDDDANTCNFGFNVVEDQPFDFWSY